MPEFDDILSILPTLPQIKAVLVGFDFHVSYAKLAVAHHLLISPDFPCIFVATNTDATFPAKHGVFPGTGSIVKALETSVGKAPIVTGKPNQVLMECITRESHLDKSRTCMVGDRLNTDIQFGKDAGLSTLLVLTGILIIVG